MIMRFISTVIVFVLLASCFSIKPQATKTGKNLWEDFFVSPGVMQYFVKPLPFKSIDQSIEIDFTFRNISDSVTVNYSIYSNQESHNPDNVIISSKLTTIKICCQKTLTSEYIHKKHKLRQTGRISFSEFSALTKNNAWTITIQNGNINDLYFASQKTMKNIETIDRNLMITLNQ